MPNDKFGVKMLYPSKVGGEEWFISTTPNADSRLVRNGHNIGKIEDGSYDFINTTSTDQVRISALTTAGQPASPNCSVNYTNLASTGYRFSPKDWRNVEMTLVGYVDDITDLTNAFIFMETRSGKKVNPVPCCDGHSYGLRAYLDPTGPNRALGALTKSMYWNITELRKTTLPIIDGSFYRRWFGLKLVVSNFINSSGGTNVGLEYWLTTSHQATDLANNWTNSFSEIDNTNNWGTGGTTCGGTDKQAITWGSYLSSFGFYGGGPSFVRLKYLSVREIDYNGSFGTGGGSSGGGGTTPPTNTIIWKSAGSWDNGNHRSWSGHEEADPDDPTLLVAAGDNRNIEILGDGTGLLSGARARLYLLGDNYNAQMELKYTPNPTIDGLSLRLRSRHNEGGSGPNRFGGYGSSLHIDSIEFAREDYHNVHTDFGTIDLPKNLVNGQEYKIRWSIKDDPTGTKVIYRYEIDFNDGNGYTLIPGTPSDNNPEDYMVDKPLYTSKNGVYGNHSSYSWIRTNADSGTPNDIKLRDVVIRDITNDTGTGTGGGTGGGTTTRPIYKFLSWGDNDTTTDAVDVLDQMITETGVSAYLFAGDGPYSSSGTAWVNMMSTYFTDANERKQKLFMAQGNHEHPESQSQQTEDDLEAWMPGLHNAVEGLEWVSAKRVGNAYVIVMNSQDDDLDVVGSAQYNFVAAELVKAKALRASKDIDWIICMVHKSWFNLLSSNQAYVTARHTYASIFRDAQVDFMFHGHNHNVHIWRPIVAIAGNNNNTGGQDVFTLAGDGRYDFSKDHGVIYCTNGNGGHEHNTFGQSPTANVLFSNDTTYGYSVLEIQGKQATLKHKDVNGNVLFSVGVTRGVDDPITTPGGGTDPGSGGGGTNPDPATPETLYNDFTIRYNINSDSDGCICNAPPFVPPPPNPDPDPDPGGNPTALYDFLHTGSGVDAVHIGKDSGNSNRYLSHGIIILDDDADLFDQAVLRVEIPLKKNSGGDLQGTAKVVVRNGDTNAIEETIGTIDVTQVQETTQYYPVENTASDYKLQEGDMILLEYDENEDDDDYLIAFTRPEAKNGVKVAKRDNTMSANSYRYRDLEMAMRVFGRFVQSGH